jgi:SAM-dependent methyltransferase
MKTPAFQEKDPSYYNVTKVKMLPLIPPGPNVVLDLGCAAGRTGLALLETKRAAHLVGVEMFEPAAQEARKHYHEVLVGDIEAMQFDYRDRFDFVICGDVLEHLRNPYRIVKEAYRWLKPGGHLLVCLPNVRFWEVIKDLLLFGKWDYIKAGIMDETHLRFFTRSSAVRMVEEAGFEVVSQQMLIHGSKKNFANRLTAGVFEEFLGLQVLVSGRRP